MNETPRYPDWLGPLLLRSGLWPLRQPTTMATFLARYTLHDSEWIGCWLDPVDGSATAALRWDTFWTDGAVPFPGSTVADWPILLLLFEHVQHVDVHLERTDQFLSTIVGATTQASAGLWRTTITGVLGNLLHIVHSEAIGVICFAATGQQLYVSNLES